MVGQTDIGSSRQESYRNLKPIFEWIPPILLEDPSQTSSRSWFDQIHDGNHGSAEIGSTDTLHSIEIVSLSYRLSQKLLPKDAVEAIFADVLDNESIMRKITYKGLNLVLNLNNPLGPATIYAQNIRQIFPMFLKEYEKSMIRFITKILVGTSKYNIIVETLDEFKILLNGAALLFDTELPNVNWIFTDILKYDKGISRLSHEPDYISLLNLICLQYFECALVFEDILGKIADLLEERYSAISSRMRSSTMEEIKYYKQEIRFIKLYLKYIALIKSSLKTIMLN